MAKNQSFSKELVGLGKDISTALKTMVKSREFKNLEKEVITGVKSISKSLKESLNAAQKSQQTARLTKKIKKVAKAGKKQGTIEAKKAQVLATQGIRKAREAIKKINKRKGPPPYSS